MIPARIATLLVLVACWHGVWLLGGRAEGFGMATALALVAALGMFAVRARHHVAPARLITVLIGCAAGAASGIALIEMGAMIAAIAFCVLPRPRWPAIGLALLALPVLPTLDILLAYPLRRVSAILTTWLLRLNGIGVRLDGVALEWHGQQLLFDGPCSGVRMLWATMVLACLYAVIRSAPPLRFVAIIAGALVLAIIGNALRASSLFYLESGFLPIEVDPMLHEGIGLAAFAMLILATLFLSHSRRNFI